MVGVVGTDWRVTTISSVLNLRTGYFAPARYSSSVRRGRMPERSVL